MPRVLVGELMDDPALDPGQHEHALRGLARLNAASAVARQLYPILRRTAGGLGRPMTVVDVATGSADVPVALLALAKREGVRFDLTACDISARALEIAAQRARNARVPLRTRTLDVLAEDPPRADVLLCTLFLHHLRDDHIRLVLEKLAAAADRQVLVSDLRRGPWGTTLAAIVPRLATRSSVVHVDALRSARAALSMQEARTITRETTSGGSWSIRPAFPARMLIRWSPGETSTRS